MEMSAENRFEYIGVIVSGDVIKPKVLSRMTQASAAVTKLNAI